MKKKFLGLAIAALALTSFTGFAQKPAACDSTCQSGKMCRQDKDMKGKKDKKAINPFEGITLTDAQKTQLEAVKAKRAEKAKARKADKQRMDSAQRVERRAAKKEYFEEVKAILTPDQYVVFLENQVFTQGGDRGKSFDRPGKKDGKDRGVRPDKKGNRPDKDKKGARPDKKDRK